MNIKLKSLNVAQKAGWYFSTFIYGIFVFAIPGYGDAYTSTSNEELYVIYGILGLAWLVGVVGLRIYIQDKDPSNFWSLLGVTRKNE